MKFFNNIVKNIMPIPEREDNDIFYIEKGCIDDGLLGITCPIEQSAETSYGDTHDLAGFKLLLPDHAGHYIKSKRNMMSYDPVKNKVSASTLPMIERNVYKRRTIFRDEKLTWYGCYRLVRLMVKRGHVLINFFPEKQENGTWWGPKDISVGLHCYLFRHCTTFPRSLDVYFELATLYEFSYKKHLFMALEFHNPKEDKKGWFVIRKGGKLKVFYDVTLKESHLQELLGEEL